MNKIEVSGIICPRIKKLAKFVADSVLKILNQPDSLEVAISFVGKKEIKRLNNENRNIDKVTDVLSFPALNVVTGKMVDIESDDVQFLKTDDGFIHLGDMAICTKKCKEQAKEFNTSFNKELKKLIIHSILHLLGYDHIKDSDYEIMNAKEIELDKKIGGCYGI